MGKRLEFLELKEDRDMLLQTVRPNIVQSIRAYRVEDLLRAAEGAGQHFLYVNLTSAQTKQDVLSDFGGKNFSAFKTALIDLAVAKLGPVERAVLRIATFELSERIDIPCRVVLNEAIALTKKFGAAESHRFVNGVLDKVARELRETEINRPR